MGRAFDRGTESPSMTVLEGVASIKDEPIECPYDTVDSDALNTLIEAGGASVQFEYEGYTVEVTDERVRATDTRSV
ncbi:HalOD1 output domain-containing protein [Halorhabdus rudnickae]|uniref:HalOD1 output domain-containing protein n=1 Tax=Halorhabdus rudnickae TaxID=1775544 RepID=UPI0010838C99|nr:HalOD1 output domain-containing protein [Halorhabdus rudnickae]